MQPPSFRSQEDYDRARIHFAEAGFTDAAVLDVVGARSQAELRQADRAELMARTAGGSPVETLIRLFLLGVPVADGAAAFLPLEAWTSARLLVRRGATVRATVRLLPIQGLLIGFDRPERAREAGYVMGVAASTLALANLTVRRPSRATLDLGSGCGFHAFLAAGHSKCVVASDRNPRSVAMAMFNARLNGLGAVECKKGDLFAPVEGREFDLVISNPPFVISPESKLIYRDSGLGGDAITRRIAREVPAHLAEGGFCQILTNWAHLRGQDSRERLATWFAGTGCDAWVMTMETGDAATYARTWIRQTERGSSERQYDRWMEYYEREGIEAVSGGLITLRRRTGRNWFRADVSPSGMVGPCGDAVQRHFLLRDFLEATADDEVLIQRRLRASPDLRLNQECEPGPEGWKCVGRHLRLTKGLAFTGGVDAPTASVVAACTGTRTLDEVLRMHPDLPRAAVVPTVRTLIEQGLLLPVGLEAEEREGRRGAPPERP